MRLALALTLALLGCTRPEVDEGQADSDVSAGGMLRVDEARGARIAATALRVNGRRSASRCLFEVQNSLEKAEVKKFPRLPGAVDMDDFMARQGPALTGWGFQKQSRSIDGIPKGSIIAWRPGQCGYHATYGHIEIAVGDGRACSDFCGTIKRGCGAPNVYVPVLVGVGSAAAAGLPTDDSAPCEVRDDGKLYCNNKQEDLHASPDPDAPVVNRLTTSFSWFECWKHGEPHAQGKTVWLYTLGDDNEKRGWAPSSVLENAPAEFHTDPSKKGLRACETAGKPAPSEVDGEQ